MIDWILSSHRILELPDRLTDVTSWHTHVPFAFWCVEALEPRVLVELGTHRGDSYSAFCQAVARSGRSTACYAVDTWRGDPQAGVYGEEVYQDFRAYHDVRYSGFSRLLRCTFDEASTQFSDGSIDLLHIDGLHTYQAVRHDFETWAPRVSPSGVVLFHDVNVREGDFGVWKLWEELSREHPAFTFHHGHGLGVLLLGPDAQEPARRLAGSTPEQAAEIRGLFARLGEGVAWRGRSQVLEAERRASRLERDDLIQQRDRVIRERDQLVQERDRLVQERDRAVQERDQRTAHLAAAETESRGLRERLASESAMRAGRELEVRQARELLELAHRPRGSRRVLDSLRRRRTVRALAASGLFDEEYYRRNVDVGEETNPIRHYVKYGVWRGGNPHPMFDTMFYLRENPDVARRGVNPLLHFARWGASQGRRPHPDHSAQEYLRAAQGLGAADAPTAAVPASASPATEVGPVPRVTFRPAPLPSAPGAVAPGDRRPPVAITIVACHVLPFPPRAGNEYRIHRMVRWLRSIGHEVHLVVCPPVGEAHAPHAIERAAQEYPSIVICGRDGTLQYRSDRPEISRALEALDGEQSHAFSAPAPGDRLRSIEVAFCPDHLMHVLLRLAEAVRPDVLIANYIFMSRVLPLLPGRTLRLIDTHDVFSAKARKVVSFGLRDDLAVSPQEEAALLRRADLVVAIQPEEERELREMAPDRAVVTAGVDFEVTRNRSPPPRDPVVLYVGSNNALNVHGIRNFLQFSWPIVRRERPDARLRIVGPVCDSIDGGVEGIELLGRVDVLEDAYAAARVIVNPAVAGTGLKVKTVEALSNLRPIVLWPTGVDGLSPELAKLCHVASDWNDFSRKVLHLLAADEAGDLASRRDQLAEALSPERVYAALGAALEERMSPGNRSGDTLGSRPGEER